MNRWLQVLLATTMIAVRVASADEAVSQKVQLNIPAQEMGDALNQFGRQSGLIVMMYSVLAQGMKSPPLVGSYTAMQALDHLLAKTGLIYEFIDERTVAIRSSNESRAAAPAGSQKPVAQELEAVMKVAQAAESPESQREPGAAAAGEGSQQTGNSAGQASDATKIGEIVVTAQKREERLQDVPISISVMTGVELDKSTAQGVTEMLTRVPSISITESFQGGGAQVTMRGVPPGGLVNAGSTPVAYYLDTVPFAFTRNPAAPEANAYDLDRVEVLRGPQGTLYGAAALAGVVRVLTKDADLNAFEFKGRAMTSATRYGGQNYRGDLAVNLPVIEDKLALRGAVSYQDLSGWIDRPDRSNVNDAQIGTYRLKLRARPLDALTIDLSAWLSRSDVGGVNTSLAGRTRPTRAEEPILTDYNVYGLKIVYDFAKFSLQSATSYLDYEIYSILNPFHDISERRLTFEPFAKTVAQEINLSSTHQGQWRWSAGTIYRHNRDSRKNLFINVFPSPQDVHEESKSYAVFGELTRIFGDGELELTGGLRYFRDRMTSTDVSRFNGAAPAGLYAASRFSAVTPRVVLDWRPHAGTTLYASYAEGFRSGLHHLPLVQELVPTLTPTKPDRLGNYELGAKSCLFGCSANLEAAIYYMDWEDPHMQIGVPFAGVTSVTTINSEPASGIGADLGISGQVAEGLTLGANVSWNDLSVDADVFSGGVVLLAKGERLLYSPETTAGVSADYAFPLGTGGYTGRFSASANYSSKYRQKRVAGGVVTSFATDDFMIGRASFSVQAPNGWTATLFADNINNEQGVVSVFAESPHWHGRPRPRTIGVQFDYQL